MLAQVATTNRFTTKNMNSIVERCFSKEALEMICRTAIGKPIVLNFGNTPIALVSNAFIVNDSAVIEFDDKDLEFFRQFKYIVPGARVASSEGGVYNTVRIKDFSLTNNPTDKTLMTIEEINME